MFILNSEMIDILQLIAILIAVCLISFAAGVIFSDRISYQEGYQKGYSNGYRDCKAECGGKSA